ncbi:ATP-binding protein [Paenibacillus sp. FSL K6-0276]|uniref:ATP-binding protein n=1 Tax=Paenibacillus sp. FSL K6-0276 TaxID=2921450 RepID=UPI0030ECFBA6
MNSKAMALPKSVFRIMGLASHRIIESMSSSILPGSNKQSTLRGLGLGLTFSHLLAESMNGSLVLEKHSDEGCTFVLSLPLDH